MEDQKIIFLGLGYNVQIKPSRLRVYVWRKLREMGAIYFKQGLAILPNTELNHKKMERLRDHIEMLGGEATIVEMSFSNPKDEASIIERFKQASAEEYNEIAEDCNDLVQSVLWFDNTSEPNEEKNMQVKQVLKKYRKAKEREFFSPENAHELEEKVEQIVLAIKNSTGDLYRQIQKLLDFTKK